MGFHTPKSGSGQKPHNDTNCITVPLQYSTLHWGFQDKEQLGIILSVPPWDRGGSLLLTGHEMAKQMCSSKTTPHPLATSADCCINQCLRTHTSSLHPVSQFPTAAASCSSVSPAVSITGPRCPLSPSRVRLPTVLFLGRCQWLWVEEEVSVKCSQDKLAGLFVSLGAGVGLNTR